LRQFLEEKDRKAGLILVGVPVNECMDKNTEEIT